MLVLVTGGGGFIGSHLVRGLLARGDRVRVVDDFATGRRSNLEDVLEDLELFEGSILDGGLLQAAMRGVEVVFHEAAIPSVPRSVAEPLTTTRVNVEGTLAVFESARVAGVRRVVYASSSSVYGDASVFPLEESLPLRPLSPYAASKASNELFAAAYSKLHGLDLVGLRYFNVFGARQNPRAQYAAVIPAFIQALREGSGARIYGDGKQERDFTHVDNVVEANLLAARHAGPAAGVYNVAGGTAVSLLELYAAVKSVIGSTLEPEFLPARAGDLPRSFADISRAGRVFGYRPVVGWREGLRRTVAWFAEGHED